MAIITTKYGIIIEMTSGTSSTDFLEFVKIIQTLFCSG